MNVGRNEKKDGAKHKREDIQWMERQTARLVRFSGYPETHRRMCTKREGGKNT